VPAVPALRQSLAARFGEQRYRGLFSLVSAAGLVVIVAGYAHASSASREMLFAPFPAARSAAPVAMMVAFVLFASANMRGHIRRVVQHPMLLGLIIWSLVHLLANGEVRATVLFGAFLAYALVDLASAISRRAVKAFQPQFKYDLMAVVGGLVVAYLVVVFHRVLFGVPVASFGV
jgi:uncharacterized membrane protein